MKKAIEHLVRKHLIWTRAKLCVLLAKKLRKSLTKSRPKTFKALYILIGWNFLDVWLRLWLKTKCSSTLQSRMASYAFLTDLESSNCHQFNIFIFDRMVIGFVLWYLPGKLWSITQWGQWDIWGKTAICTFKFL